MSQPRSPFWETDVAPATWLRAALGPWAHDVASFVPRGFAAHARVLHPAGENDLPGGERQRWADIARANGRIAHATMQFHNIAHPRGSREEKVRWLERSWSFGPALWWPDDRAWVVVTEIDFGCTYVGGSDETIERVLAHPELEAWPAQRTDRFTDLLNAALDAPGV